MTVQGRDVIFTFERSCNSDCFKWFSCSKCCNTELEDTDPVFVTPRGMVKHFDYKARGGANANAKRTLSNIQAILQEMAESQGKMQAILVALEARMNLSLEPVVPHILNASQIKKIEEIALPIIHGADSPEPIQPPNSPTHSDAVVEDYFGALPNIGMNTDAIHPLTPKRGARTDTNLVRSPKMRDLRLEENQE